MENILPEFRPFPKIPRLSRTVTITEKIDGSNGAVFVGEDGTVRAASRTRWITPENDNFGFAAWVRDHAEELRGLGEGLHFGEWWGRGIQRGYGLDHRRFSLFNVSRWSDDDIRPACCDVVPALMIGPFDTGLVDTVIDKLARKGSCAAPGFMKPEGIMIYHHAAKQYFKKMVERDDEPKSRTV